MSEEKKREEEAKDAEVEPLEDNEAEKVGGGIGTTGEQGQQDTSDGSGSGSGWWSNPNR